jgi:uncharacterized protein (TIGR02246 family)
MLVAGWATFALGQKGDADVVAAVHKNEEKLTAFFNAGKAEEVAAMFLASGELIDEEGTVYQGREQIQELLSAFFERFPGAKLTLDIESIRPVGPVAIEEGVRSMTDKDGVERSHFRYIAVWARGDDGWRLASFRDFPDDPAPTPHDRLQAVAWLVGDWVNEGAEGRVAIQYRWSDDQNYLLGDFQILSADGEIRKSSQRIGWDPSTGKIRSWLFDADGGFAEGVWTVLEDGAVVKSSSVNPDGVAASATLKFTLVDKDRFTIAGVDRVVGDVLEDDFEITVVRRPPAAEKK